MAKKSNTSKPMPKNGNGMEKKEMPMPKKGGKKC